MHGGSNVMNEYAKIILIKLLMKQLNGDVVLQK